MEAYKEVLWRERQKPTSSPKPFQMHLNLKRPRGACHTMMCNDAKVFREVKHQTSPPGTFHRGSQWFPVRCIFNCDTNFEDLLSPGHTMGKKPFQRGEFDFAFTMPLRCFALLPAVNRHSNPSYFADALLIMDAIAFPSLSWWKTARHSQRPFHPVKALSGCQKKLKHDSAV